MRPGALFARELSSTSGCNACHSPGDTSTETLGVGTRNVTPPFDIRAKVVTAETDFSENLAFCAPAWCSFQAGLKRSLFESKKR